MLMSVDSLSCWLVELGLCRVEFERCTADSADLGRVLLDVLCVLKRAWGDFSMQQWVHAATMHECMLNGKLPLWIMHAYVHSVWPCGLILTLGTCPWDHVNAQDMHCNRIIVVLRTA
jgi:hypothetical protein